MRALVVGGIAAIAAVLPVAPSLAWMHGGGAHWEGNASSWHAQGFRGAASGGDGSWSATGYRGGSASGGDGSWHATGYRGGTASGGDGSWSAHGADGGSASGGGGYWHATGESGSTVYGGYNRYYGGTYDTYHPPVTVNDYYGSGCYDCGGWNTAGAAAVGLAAGSMIGAAAAGQESANAYAAGVAAGEAVGSVATVLPANCVYTPVAGASYYKCGPVWYQPSYGANGVFYRVVTAP